MDAVDATPDAARLDAQSLTTPDAVSYTHLRAHET